MLNKLVIQAYEQVGPIAQSVEQRTFNPWVDGSSPSGPTFYLYYSALGLNQSLMRSDKDLIGYLGE